MRRLYHRDEWFDELSPLALAEAEFEELLIQNGDIIHPNTFVVPFKKTVFVGDSSARGDLAVISRDYRHWMVVEVEMIQHDLYRHVIPQVRTLREGRYSQEHALYLASRNSNLDLASLTEMLRGSPPDVLVLLNKPDEEWRRELARYDAFLIIFEIFRSLSNRHIFVMDGEAPRLAHDFLTELSFSQLPRLLLVSSPAALDFGPGQRVRVFVEEQLTYWERFNTATEVYLTPVGVMPIKPGQKYALVKMDGGEYAIRPSKSRG